MKAEDVASMKAMSAAFPSADRRYRQAHALALKGHPETVCRYLRLACHFLDTAQCRTMATAVSSAALGQLTKIFACQKNVDFKTK
jgi:hypothetical protein